MDFLSTGMFLESNGSSRSIPNFGLLGHSEIGTYTYDDPSIFPNLFCRTDNTSCCRGHDNPAGSGFGYWFYPSGNMVLFRFQSYYSRYNLYVIQRGPQFIRLYRHTNATANGIYRCELADQNGVVQTRYVGLYTEGAGELDCRPHMHNSFYLAWA